MKHLTLYLFVFLLFYTVELAAQVSWGGYPKTIIENKSGNFDQVKMPSIQSLNLISESIREFKNTANPQPLRFAHPFEVNFSPANSGTWAFTEDGYKCWRLNIRSEGALSINLIFNEFELPEGSLLYIYNKDKSHVLGAFTSANNKVSGKFAVSPVRGEEVVVHYETPDSVESEIPFVIKQVNHDFLGILEKDSRRPLGVPAGSCNVDVNCELGEEWDEVKNAVCRMIVKGIEICTGTLINNTAEDMRPYVLSADHCYDEWEYAEESVYTFNYESPYCAPLDGDPSNSVSGAIMKAKFDSLDFALVELSIVPPPEYRPYFAGWDRESKASDSTVSIHHPYGDIKKIALDEDPPVISDYDSGSDYIPNAFFKIIRWDEGVTEVGSSGGPLFSTEKLLMGTLTGGAARCGSPVKDYFSRFELAWDYKSDSTRQLKHWLDPTGTGETKLDGKQFYEEEDLCGAFTNLNDQDEHSLVVLKEDGKTSGYWGGSNSAGITEFMERYSLPGNEILYGVSMGIGKLELIQDEYNSQIKIKVYTGREEPEELILEQTIDLNNLVEDAMNTIPLQRTIQPSDTFFIGFELSRVHPADSFAVYQSLRGANTDNSFYFFKDGAWYDFEDANLGYNSMVNVFEVVACNIKDTTTNTPGWDTPGELFVYPNPAYHTILVNTKHESDMSSLEVINLLGQQAVFSANKLAKNQIEVNLAGNKSGLYIVRIKSREHILSTKISYLPR